MPQLPLSFTVSKLEKVLNRSSTLSSLPTQTSPKQQPSPSPEPSSKRPAPTSYSSNKKEGPLPRELPIGTPPAEIEPGVSRIQPSYASSSSTSSAIHRFYRAPKSPVKTTIGLNFQQFSQTSFSRQLGVFLASLHTSLESTSAILFEAGVKEFSLLVAFLSMAEGTRDKVLSEVHLPLLQKHLLRKELRSIEASWKAEANKIRS